MTTNEYVALGRLEVPLTRKYVREDNAEIDHQMAVQLSEVGRELGWTDGEVDCYAAGFLAGALAVHERHLQYHLRTMPYSEYLRTPHWQLKRALALENARNRCQLCNGSERLEVHHRTYERRGCELLSDLTVLCAACHGKHHDKE